jgi:hypothetical protein
MTRQKDLDRLYSLLDELQLGLGGRSLLRESRGSSQFPRRGVYFFFEPGEYRADGAAMRVVRVGTHAISIGSRTTLWSRLSQHRGALGGSLAGGGNHRGSIFRLHVGAALLRSRGEEFLSARASWGRGNNADRSTRTIEYQLELAVSDHIGAMPFVCVPVDDEPGASSERGRIERTCIALLSNARKPAVDPPSPDWLGRNAEREAIRESGLWNVNHVYEDHGASALDTLEAHIRRVAPRRA